MEPLDLSEDIRLRLGAQRALLTHVTPQIRAVSIDYDADQHRVFVRLIFDSQPSQSALDAAACVGTEIIADYPEGWKITEEIVVCPAPGKMNQRRLVVYHRCEN